MTWGASAPCRPASLSWWYGRSGSGRAGARCLLGVAPLLCAVAFASGSWPGQLSGEEQAAPGVGEELLVTFRAPAPLAHEELVELGGVGGPDDVGGVARITAQGGDRGEVSCEQAHLRRPPVSDLAPQRGQFGLGGRSLLDDRQDRRQAAGDA